MTKIEIITFLVVLPCFEALVCYSCGLGKCKDEFYEATCTVDSPGCYVAGVTGGGEERYCLNAYNDDQKVCEDLNRRKAKGYETDTFCNVCKRYLCNGNINPNDYLRPTPEDIRCYQCTGEDCGNQNQSDPTAVTVYCPTEECYILSESPGMIKQGCRKTLDELRYARCLNLQMPNASATYKTFCRFCYNNLCNILQKDDGNFTIHKNNNTLECFSCKGPLCFQEPYRKVKCEEKDFGCYRVLKHGMVLGRGCANNQTLKKHCDFMKYRTVCGVCKTKLCNSTTQDSFPLWVSAFSFWIIFFAKL